MRLTQDQQGKLITALKLVTEAEVLVFSLGLEPKSENEGLMSGLSAARAILQGLVKQR